MKASEIPLGHLCYNSYLDKYAIVGFHFGDNKKMLLWLHNFCAKSASECSNEYQDLGPAPRFKITQEEIVKTVVKFEVVNT